MINMKLSSPAFENGGEIPEEYTCDREGISPLLLISDVPHDAKSLALVMEDPDAPSGAFIHWLLWNIPPKTTTITKGESVIYPQGKTSARKQGYVGPCPLSGSHHYYLKLYALDIILPLKAGAEKKDLEKMMTGHQITTAQLLGIYKRK